VRAGLVARASALPLCAAIALCTAAVALCAAAVALCAAAAPAAVAAWSTPRTLQRCGVVAGPLVAFPSDSPSSPTGAGAIVWASSRARCGPADGSSADSGATALWTAAIGADGAASTGLTRSLAAQPASGALASVGASFGRVAVAAAAPRAVTVLQGSAGGVLTASLSAPTAGQPFSLTRAYLGDAAIATVAPGHAIEVRVQRYFHRGFGPVRSIPIGRGRVTALAATMDYRSDVLLAWQQEGAIYAHMLRASGRREPTQRVGPSDAYPQLQALVSDNNHGMVAWASSRRRAGEPDRTTIHVDLSRTGVLFGAPQLLSSYDDPEQAARRAGCIELLRLSTENVLLAWTAREHGRYVVRAAPAVYAANRPALTVSDPDGQAVLDALAPGPAGEADALWEAPPDGGQRFGANVQLWVSRLFIAVHDRPAAHAAERVGAAGPNGSPTIGVDPASDRAVAAWVNLNGAALEYARGPSAAGYRPRPVAAVAGAGTHWLRIAAGAVAAAVLLAGLVALALRRRRGVRG
jgi:hypothetical protein